MVVAYFNSFFFLLCVFIYINCVLVFVFPISLLSHARLRCMCTCNRCTFCLCQNFLNSELLQTVRAKLYAVVLIRFFLPFTTLSLPLLTSQICRHRHLKLVPFISPHFLLAIFLPSCGILCNDFPEIRIE